MRGFDFKYFIEVFPILIKALPITLSIAIFAMAFGLVMGISITFLRKTPYTVVNKVFGIYVSFFRGTPLMVQLFLFFFGLPQIIPALSSLNAYYAALIVMSINASAYISEIMRGSIDAVDSGQMEAALSVGMTKFQAMERIVLPQALKIAVPSLGNTMVSLIQGTAITFMLGIKDIMGVSKVQAAASYRFLEAYLAVGIIYWVITWVFSKLNDRLEYRLSKGGLV